jgi:RNA polymerase sigma-70 factor (ECF subfamily)
VSRIGRAKALTFQPDKRLDAQTRILLGTQLGVISSHKRLLVSQAPDSIEKAKQGDPQVFHDLVRPHLDSIRRFARSFCKSEEDADDLTQDALIKAYRSFASFDGRSSLTTWLYTIAKNQFLDSRRGKLFRWRHRESELSDTDPSTSPNAEALLGERERVEFLWATLRRLDEKFRIPLVLAEIDGLPYEQVAEIERIPVGTVRSRISRAKEQLRALLGPMNALPEPFAAGISHASERRSAQLAKLGSRGTISANASSHALTKAAR